MLGKRSRGVAKCESECFIPELGHTRKVRLKSLWKVTPLSPTYSVKIKISWINSCVCGCFDKEFRRLSHDVSFLMSGVQVSSSAERI
jgi:hypothetical protein